jgi:hypothetical protein
VELLARIEATFGIRLGEALLGSAETPRDLLAAIATMAAIRRRPMTQLPSAEAALTASDDRSSGSRPTLVEVLLWHAQRHPVAAARVLFQRSPTETDTLTYGELLAPRGGWRPACAVAACGPAISSR